MGFRANHIAGYGMADVRRAQTPLPQTITYYDYTSTLKKKQGPQPRTVMIQGLFRNDLQVGIERSDTGDSIDLTIETIQKRLDEFEKAQKGEENTFHDDNGNVTRQYHAVKEFSIKDEATPESLRNLTWNKIGEIMKQRSNGAKGKKEAIDEAEALFNVARRILISQ